MSVGTKPQDIASYKDAFVAKSDGLIPYRAATCLSLTVNGFLLVMPAI